MVSCDEDYLDVTNLNAPTQSGYYTTAEHALQAVVACYDPIKGNGLYGLRITHMSIAIGDFGIYEAPSFEQLIYNADDEHVQFIWGYAYRGITKCNLALNKIAGIEDPALDDALRSRLIGEIKFLKSYYNFVLHTRFNEPPLLNEIITDMQATFGNNTWAEFLEQIEKDLKGYTEDCEYVSGAIELLPETYDAENVGRATKGAALTLLGKTYLYHEQFDSAKKYLQQVENLGLYELSMPQGTDSADYVCAFLANSSAQDLVHKDRVYIAENNSESIFSIQFANTDFIRTPYLPGWMCDGHILNAYNGINGWRNTAVAASYVDQFEVLESHPAGLVRDPRLYGTVYVEGDTITNKKSSEFYRPFDPGRDMLQHISEGYGIKKGLYPLHEEGAAPFNAPHDWRLFKYSDVLLMLAEAEYHVNGSTPLALNALNQLRERAGLEPLEAVTPEAIMHEHACELGLEGVRFWNLVRWGRLGGEWPSPEDFIPYFIPGKHEFLPIPTTEITKMQGELKQNPEW